MNEISRLVRKTFRVYKGMNMPRVKQINHVAVVVDDMEKALSFWRDGLGMELHELRDVPAFGGWLARIARRRAIDGHRRRRVSETLRDPAVAAPDPVEALAVLAVIRGLPPAYRETLVLRLVQGMTGPEIALTTGMTPGSVRVNLHRGMAIVRKKLGGRHRDG